MNKLYQYVGPSALLALAETSSSRRLMQTEADILLWIKETQQKPNAENEVTATFIINRNKNLWIADRHSEHVSCAAGQPVFSAGEITLKLLNAKLEVAAITNQSTGYCPQPESWPSVAEALDGIGLVRPNDFTTRFDFRLCKRCGSINIIKDEWFVCGVCDSDLDREWNFDSFSSA